jgi:PDZ domain-containing secreted protein
VIRPGPVIDVSHDIVISGARVHQPHGRYLLLTVRADRPSLLGLAMAAVHGGSPIERVDEAAPGTAAHRRRQFDEEFAQSQRDAASAAAAALGIPGSRPGWLPFTVEFRHHNVVGPSGGLIYALAIEDLLSGDDRARGRVIAATGEVNAAGDVEPVAYVNEKAIGARHAGAQLLLTPTSEAYEAVGAGLPVTGVSSVKEALSRLAES